MNRARLQNRRRSESFAFRWNNRPFTAAVSRFSNDGRLAEIFLSNGKVGSDTDAAARDSALVCSIALQYGAPVELIRKGRLRDEHGIASSPLDLALDLLADDPECP